MINAIKKAWAERRVTFEINLSELLLFAAFVYWLCKQH